MTNVYVHAAKFEDMIIPDPSKIDDGSRVNCRNEGHLHLIANNAVFDHSWWGEAYRRYHRVWCKEHKQYELVPDHNSRWDLGYWYKVGLHPRFSILRALLNAGQRPVDFHRIMDDLRADDEDPPRRFRMLLKSSKNEEDFAKKVDDFLRVNLYWRRRRYRVTKVFKKRFKARSFNATHFFAENNQELRRIMLNRGVAISDVLGHMSLVSEDSEGKIYDHGGARYLFVKCPSTGQEYLLGIPRWKSMRRWDEDKKAWAEPAEFESPSEARRWGFNLEPDAKFLQEA
jgi:hypothetical protein